jgi:hypothetical protein
MANGFIIYEGPSRIDGSPIVCIATLKTGNAKTGHLVSTWIIRSDKHPMDAINDGSDRAICGNCPLRGEIRDASERTKPGKFGGDTVNKGRSCYVNVAQAPAAIYKAYKEGKYAVLTKADRRQFIGRGLRYGSYGDPVAVPMKAWKLLESLCTGKTQPGYTHQWRNTRFKAWSKKLMASTHSEQDNAEAHEMGWRTFRTIITLDAKATGEIICPASKEGDYRATCETCGACNGRRDAKDGRASVAIVAHGGDGKLQLVEKVVSRFSLTVL